jgi:hypothetical protein
MFNFIKNLFRAETAKPIIEEVFFISKKRLLSNKIYNFGNKNPNKTFYVIKKFFSPNGFFSNLTFYKLVELISWYISFSYIWFCYSNNFLFFSLPGLKK